MNSSVMKALRFAEFGPPSVLRIEEVAIPEPPACAYLKRGRATRQFQLIDFYHNFSRLLGADSFGLTPRQISEIEEQLLRGFETGVLKPPPIEIVPFEKAADAYSRMAARDAKAKQVLSFDWPDEQNETLKTI